MNKFALALGMFISAFAASAADMSRGADNFYKSEKVTQQKVTFKNQYQMNVVGNLFMPKTLNQNAKNPAIVVGHPMGAVKEQSANLYAQRLAKVFTVNQKIDLKFSGFRIMRHPTMDGIYGVTLRQQYKSDRYADDRQTH